MDAPGSGLMGWLLAMVGQHLGYPVPRGGAGMLSLALQRRFESLGGRVVTGTRVERVLVTDGRATGVLTEHGEVVLAGKAVVADVSAPALYGGLVPWEDLPARWRRRMQRFEWDPGTVKVDWALDGTVPWSTPPGVAPGTVHISESVDELVVAGGHIAAHTVPDRPFLLMGQMAAADPTRAPSGKESLWAYTHVPQEVRRDV